MRILVVTPDRNTAGKADYTGAFLPESMAFERARNRPGIRHIVAEIPSLVDARDDQIGQAPVDLRDGDVHAIGWCAVHAVDRFANALEPKRTTKRQCVTDGARFFDRRHDRHISKWSQGVGELKDSVRPVTIVVRDQNERHALLRLYDEP